MSEKLNHLSLFSGYEGFGLGLKLAGIPIRTVGYVEIEPYCQKIIQARIRDGFLDWAPIIRDIRSADFRPMAGLVDIVTAGFPCQPHSFAGRRRGESDERNLWPDTLRVIREVGPGYVLLENVPGILANGYAGTVVGELSEIGYDCLWHCVPAASVGAPHLRWRWWLLAHNDGSSAYVAHSIGKGMERWTEQELLGQQPTAERNGHEVADAIGNGRPRCGPTWRGWDGLEDGGSSDARANGESENGLAESWGERGYWAVEPDVGRVADGVASRVDRLKAAGNGIVPAVVQRFLRG